MARTMAEPDRLATLVERLERTAAELRTGELSTERAAAPVSYTHLTLPTTPYV